MKASRPFEGMLDVIEMLVADDLEPWRTADRDSRDDVIPVFFTIDDAYAPYLGVALRSLIDNADPTRTYDIVILHEELSPNHRAKLESLAQPGFNLAFIRMRDRIEGITAAHHNKLRQDYFTLTIFLRLFIPSLFPEYDKVIYLDSDVVVPGDIAKLFDVDLGGNLIGACRDASIVDIPELVAYTDRGVGVGIERYINSGVLLMNAKALREAKLDQRFLDLLSQYAFENIAPDQDYLNVMCAGKIRYLDPCWDAMPVIGKPEMERPSIVHYNLFAKPWCYDGIPYAERFWRFATRTPFLKEIQQHKHGYSDEQKASDAACMQALVTHANEIAQASSNFRTVFAAHPELRL